MRTITVSINDVHNYGSEVSYRSVAGDLVGIYRNGTFYVDQSDTWLFDWEKNDPGCYARKMQAKGSFPLNLINREYV